MTQKKDQRFTKHQGTNTPLKRVQKDPELRRQLPKGRLQQLQRVPPHFIHPLFQPPDQLQVLFLLQHYLHQDTPLQERVQF